jgi:uncharacterized phiE125 gp8 family phage protein
MNGSFALTVVTAPSVEPITVAEAKDHLRVSVSTQDTYIGALVTAARNWAEAFLGRAIVSQTLRLDLPCFEDRMYLPRSATAVSHVKYLAQDGTLTTLGTSVYSTEVGTEGGAYVHLAYNQTWPTARYVNNAVQITYTAGYPALGSPQDYRANVPEAIKLALKMHVQAHYDDMRTEDRVALLDAVKNILWPYRLLSF